VVIGAHAVAVHGRPRATGDLDIWVRPTPANAECVWAALVGFGAPLHELTKADLVSDGLVFRIGVAPNRNRPPYDDRWRRLRRGLAPAGEREPVGVDRAGDWAR
jgi:hypothetical protein